VALSVTRRRRRLNERRDAVGVAHVAHAVAVEVAARLRGGERAFVGLGAGAMAEVGDAVAVGVQ
jgi:hypothetical protein